MLLRRRHQRLDDVDVALPAVRLELRLQAVVAEALDLDGGEVDGQLGADVGGQLPVGTAGEDDDVAHGTPQGWGRAVPRRLTGLGRAVAPGGIQV